MDTDYQKNSQGKNKYHLQLQQKEQKYVSLETDLKILEDQRKKAHSNFEHARHHIDKLFAESEWIANEKEFLGQQRTNNDFEKMNIGKFVEEKQKCFEQNEDLKKRVNMKIDVMYETTERSYKELRRKIDNVKDNKKQLKKIPIDLDKQKNKIIKKT